MGQNILSNNEMADNYDRRIQLEKLTPIGREILEKYKMVRVDARTIKLVKPENISIQKKKKVSKKKKFELQKLSKE